MKRLIIQQKPFSRAYDALVAANKLLQEDYESFERALLHNLTVGDIIPGLAGIRKTRLRSANKGKRGGFRVDYIDIPELEVLHLLVIYPKNVKEDITPDEKKILVTLVKMLKEGARNGKNV